MRTLLFSLLIFILHTSYAQTDEVRLGYNQAEKKGWKIVKVVASPEGKYLAFAYRNDSLSIKQSHENIQVKIFDIRANKFTSTISNINLVFPYLLTFTDSDKLIFLTTVEGVTGKITVYDILKKSTVLMSTAIPGEVMRNVNSSIYFSKENSYLIVKSTKNKSSADFIISAYDINDEFKLIYQLPPIKANLLDLFSKNFVISPNGKYLAIKTVKSVDLLDASTGLTLKTFNYMKNDVNIGMTMMMMGSPETFISFDANDNLYWTGFNNKEYGLFIGSFADLKSTFIKLPTLLSGYFMEVIDKEKLITEGGGFSVIDLKTQKISYQLKRDNENSFTMITKLGNFKYITLDFSEKKKEYLYTNSVKIYDAITNKITGYFYTDGSDNFCIVSSDGRVDGSAVALANVYWTSRKSSLKTYLDRTIDKSYTPKLLNQLLSNQSQYEATFDIDNTISKIPSLALKNFNGSQQSGLILKSQLRSNRIEINVTSNPQEIEEVRLHQNGKLVKAIPNNGSTLYSFEFNLTNAFGNENYFFVTATSKSGIDSEKIKFTIEYNGASSEKPKLFLLTIGINQYKNPKYSLNYAQADADGVERLIKSNSASIFPEIISYSIRNDQAIKSNIIKALEEIKSKSLEQDLLMVYYAGHGVMSGEALKEREFFLVPHDITQLYGRDEILTEKGISASELKKFSQSINAQKQVFIIDACQSSGAIETLALRGAAEEKAIAQLARSTGTFWITSTGTSQFAAEFEKLGHGVFTHTLLEGIKGSGDTNKDKKLTIRELSTYIENIVPELAEKLSGEAQYPSAYSFGNDFILSLYK